MLRVMRRLGGGNEELARHAADARAGGAVEPAFDDDRTAPRGLRRAIRGQARRSGADHGDVRLDSSHLYSRMTR